MASITDRNLDEYVKNSFRGRAARDGWSIKQGNRHILQKTVAPEQTE